MIAVVRVRLTDVAQVYFMEKLGECHGMRACVHAMDMMTATALDRDMNFLRSLMGVHYLCHQNLLYYQDLVSRPFTNVVLNDYRLMFMSRRMDMTIDLVRQNFKSATNVYLGRGQAMKYWVPGKIGRLCVYVFCALLSRSVCLQLLCPLLLL